MSNDELALRVKAVEKLVRVFRLERAVYMGATLFSLLLLFWCAFRLTVSLSAQPTALAAALAGVLSGSGGILYTTSRLLRMWSDAVAVVMQTAKAATS